MSSQVTHLRPPLDSLTSGAELLRWYWLKSELIEFARSRGVRTGGGKLELVERLAAHLDGHAPREQAATARERPGPQLEGRLTETTIIPPGQRSSQALRAFFREAIGPMFRFDAPMRDFIASGGGRTLGEAVRHWHETRDRPQHDVAPQFELNRFLRAWHQANPSGTRAQALAAWRHHRSLPVDARDSPNLGGTATPPA